MLWRGATTGPPGPPRGGGPCPALLASIPHGACRAEDPDVTGHTDVVPREEAARIASVCPGHAGADSQAVPGTGDCWALPDGWGAAPGG